jgi:hypothetical protein
LVGERVQDVLHISRQGGVGHLLGYAVEKEEDADVFPGGHVADDGVIAEFALDDVGGSEEDGAELFRVRGDPEEGSGERADVGIFGGIGKLDAELIDGIASGVSAMGEGKGEERDEEGEEPRELGGVV